jgi:hypothetical protein
MILAPFRAFWAFWTKPIRAESLALFRILLGVVLLGSTLTGIGRSLTETCGPDGVCPASAIDEYLEYRGQMCLLCGPVALPILSDWLPDWVAEDVSWLNKQLSDADVSAWKEWGAKPSSAYLLFVLFVLSLVCMTLGVGTRLSILVALVLANTFRARLAWLMNGGDFLACNGLYFLLLSPSGAVWSLDRWMWRKIRGRAGSYPPSLLPANEPVFIAPWSVRLMQIQVCVMYFFTGTIKLNDAFDPRLIESEGWGAFFAHFADGDYVNGQAIYWVLNDVSLTRWSYASLPIPFWICRMMSWTTLLFEIGFTFFICIRPLRKYVLAAGLGLHFGILVLMEIGWFSQITMCWYILFVPGEQVSAFFQRLRQGFSRAPCEVSPAAPA